MTLDNLPPLKPEIYRLFDEYVHSSMSRQDFVKRLMIYTPLGMSATALADFLLPKYAKAAQIDPADARIQAGYLEYTSARGAGRMKGLLAPAQNQLQQCQQQLQQTRNAMPLAQVQYRLSQAQHQQLQNQIQQEQGDVQQVIQDSTITCPRLATSLCCSS